MMKVITEEMVQEAMVYGIREHDARRGYYISCSSFGNGATHIERIDFMNVFDSDQEAAEQAERDGIKLIHDLHLPEEHHAAYLDTPDNRLLLHGLALTEQIHQKEAF